MNLGTNRNTKQDRKLYHEITEYIEVFYNRSTDSPDCQSFWQMELSIEKLLQKGQP